MDKLGPTGARVGRRLNELRRERGLTLSDLEVKLNEIGRPILLSALSKIETGQRRVDVDDLVALARALDVSPNLLLLPDPMMAGADVELTPSASVDVRAAWRWAVQDRPPTTTRRGIFISYTHDDVAWANWIAWQLADAGYEVAIDSWDLGPGADIHAYVVEGIDRAACVIAVVSDNYQRSNWGMKEVTLALAREHLPLLPIIVDGSVPSDGPLADRQWLRLDKFAEDQAKHTLLAAVERLGIRSRPDSKPPFFPVLANEGKRGRRTRGRRGQSPDVPVMATPSHRAIVLVDIEGSTARTNRSNALMRQWLYDLVTRALKESKIAERHRDPFIDRGDGILVLIHPVEQVPKTVLLNMFVPTLSRLTAEHNAGSPDLQFRLRVAVHAGDVHYDAQGVFGEAVDAAFQLLQAPAVKQKLAGDAEASLVLVVSDDIYQSLIRHGYDGIDHRDYEELIRVEVGVRQYRGWVHLPEVES